MRGHAHLTKSRTLTERDTPASIAAWVERLVLVLDPSVPGVTAERAGRVARALVDNAQRHGAPPVKIEIDVSAFITIEVTDHGPLLPKARPDGSGSLAGIVDAIATLWDVVQHDDDSKTVTAMVPTGRPVSGPGERQCVGTSQATGSKNEGRRGVRRPEIQGTGPPPISR